MADKESTIKTIFAIDGETQYKEAIRGINQEQSNLRAEMGKIDAVYQINGDKVQYNKDKVEILNKQIDNQKRKVDEARNAMKQATAIYGENSTEAQKYQAIVTRTETSLMKLEEELRKTTEELKKQESALYQAGQKAMETGEKWQEAGQKIGKVGSTLTKTVTAPIAAIGAVGLKAAIDFETGMAGVRKTTDLTAEELEEMGQSLRNMAKEIPVGVVELTNLAETAGQLGIAKENIVDFTRVMADLGVATNIIGQEGATDMARFANIMQMSQKDFDRAGSAIVELGNNTATTEKEILSMAMRLAAAGKQANMSEADVLGIAAGLSALGMEAQAGGTAFSRVINRIQLAVDTGSEDLLGFAEVAGMSAGRFAQAWGENASDALSTFIIGLSDTTKHGRTTNEMLDELGITEIRLSDALRRTSGASELFTDALGMSNKAWEENNALQKEASIWGETTENQLKKNKQQLNDAAIDLGQKLIPIVTSLVGTVTDLVTGFSNLSPKTQDTIVKMALFAAALGPVASVTGKVVSGVGNVTSGIGKLLDKASGGAGGLGSFVDKLGGAGPTALVGAAIAASVALGVAIGKMWEMDPAVQAAYKSMGEFANSSNQAMAELMGQSEAIDQYKTELFELIDAENKTATEKARIEDLVKRLNVLMPDLNLEYKKETDQLNMTKAALEDVIDAQKRRAAEAAKAKIMAEWEETYGDILTDVWKKQHDLNILQEQSGRIEAALTKARLTGLDDYDIRMAQSSEAAQKQAGWTKELTEEQAQAVRELTGVYEDAKDKVELLTKQSTDGWSTATHAVDRMAFQTQKLTDDTDELNETIEKGQAVYNSLDGAIDSYIDGLDGMGRKSKETAGAMSDSYDKMAQAGEEYATLSSKTQKDLEDAAEKHKNAMSGFTKERFDYAKGTTKDFMKLWEDELIAFQNYHTNLQIIASKVGPDVAAELAKLGPEAAPLIQKFVNGTDEDLAKLAGIVQQRTEAAVTQAKLELGLLYNTGYSGGKDLVDGIIKGLQDNQGRAGTAAGSVGAAVERGLKARLEISSPSRVGQSLGQNFAESVGAGIGRGTDKAGQSAEDLAQIIMDSTALTAPLAPLGRLRAGAYAPGEISPAPNVTNNSDHSLEINVTVPAGESEDFGRKVGRAIADELRNVDFARGM